jgi:hypothetical protein
VLSREQPKDIDASIPLYRILGPSGRG